MKEMLLTISQAVSLLSFVPCIFVMIYLVILSANYKIILLPLLYFSTLCASLLSVFLVPFINQIQYDSLNPALIAWGNLMPAFLYLFVLQLLRADLPEKKFFIVLIPLIIVESIYFLGITDEQESLFGISDLRLIDIMPLIRVLISLVIFAILTVNVSREFRWKSNYSISARHKYWLVIQLIFFNLIMLAINLIELSDRFQHINYKLIDAILIGAFTYLVISSMFRVFTEEFLNRIGNRRLEKPQFNKLVKDVVKTIDRLMEEEKPYREQNFNREALARRLHLQEGQLSFIINNHFKKSFTELANEYRVKDAEKLLLDTSKPITSICFDTGFNSLTSFNRVFKNSTSYSPSEYRERFSSANLNQRTEEKKPDKKENKEKTNVKFDDLDNDEKYDL